MCFDIPRIKFVNIAEKEDKARFRSSVKDPRHIGVCMSKRTFRLMLICAHYL